MKRFTINKEKEGVYYLYKDTKEFIEVRADSVKDAVEQSKLETIYKIAINLPRASYILNQEDLVALQENITQPAQAASLTEDQKTESVPSQDNNNTEDKPETDEAA